MKTVNTNFPSKREYLFFFSENHHGYPTSHDINSIIKYSSRDDYEWAHAVMDRFDELLDLQVMETMHLFTNRDDKSPQREHALVKRIR